MTKFVSRDGQGNISGVYAARQPGYGQEELADDHADVVAYMASLNPVTPRLVRKSLIVERLHAAGKLKAAKAALDADLYARERWYAPDQPSVRADNPEVLALLAAIGADPEVILAAS